MIWGRGKGLLGNLWRWWGWEIQLGGYGQTETKVLEELAQGTREEGFEVKNNQSN